MDLLNLSVIWDYGDVLLKGLLTTVLLTLIVIVLAGVLAIPVALARLAHSRWIRLPADAYVEFLRGTPLILQLLYIYYVLPSVGIRLEPFTAAIIGLTANYTAYMSEVYRSGIQAVPRSQVEAASSLALPPFLTFRLIVLPQAFKIVLPALGNYLIALFKDTALASVVTVQELMFTGQIISARSYQYFTVYTVTGILYFAVGYPAALIVRRLEARSRSGWGPSPLISARPAPALQDVKSRLS
ncbi:amino acid ABC transporter permease [Microvirga sp. 2TAF3]|uniref:amino acid ABC transporter permease n=1 Tax=Microvirga sp. 2TAF3 TaxID=3233014 RepID=UPI003F9C3A16